MTGGLTPIFGGIALGMSMVAVLIDGIIHPNVPGWIFLLCLPLVAFGIGATVGPLLEQKSSRHAHR